MTGPSTRHAAQKLFFAAIVSAMRNCRAFDRATFDLRGRPQQGVANLASACLTPSRLASEPCRGGHPPQR